MERKTLWHNWNLLWTWTHREDLDTQYWPESLLTESGGSVGGDKMDKGSWKSGCCILAEATPYGKIGAEVMASSVWNGITWLYDGKRSGLSDQRKYLEGKYAWPISLGSTLCPPNSGGWLPKWPWRKAEADKVMPVFCIEGSFKTLTCQVQTQVWGHRFLELLLSVASPSWLRVSLAFLNIQIVMFLLLGDKIFCLSASFRRKLRSWVGLGIRVREDEPTYLKWKVL